MHRWPTLAVLALLLAGCSESTPYEADSGMNSPTVAPEAETGRLEANDTVAVPSRADMPLDRIGDLGRHELTTQRASFHVPASEWGMFRVVLTPELWGEERPWDGTAGVVTGILLETASATNVTFFQGTWDHGTDDGPGQVHTGFTSLHVDGSLEVSRPSVVQAIGPDPPDAPPLVEHVFLVGADVAVNVSFGFAEEGELRDRPIHHVAPDERGTVAGAGTLRIEGHSREVSSTGLIDLEQDAVLSGDPAVLGRMIHISGSGTPTKDVYLDWTLQHFDPPGAQVTNYSVQTADALHQDVWAGPTGALAYATRLVQYPGAGTIGFDVAQQFTGSRQADPASIPPWLTLSWGYADMDLRESYGWPVEPQDDGKG